MRVKQLRTLRDYPGFVRKVTKYTRNPQPKEPRLSARQMVRVEMVRYAGKV